MRALVIEHDERIPVGGVGDHLVSRGFELRVFRVLDDPTDPVAMAPYPDPTAFDAVVINGCDWSIADHPPIASSSSVWQPHAWPIPSLALLNE